MEKQAGAAEEAWRPVWNCSECGAGMDQRGPCEICGCGLPPLVSYSCPGCEAVQEPRGDRACCQVCGFEARTPARASAERAAPQLGAEQSDRESQDYINHLEQQLEEANARILEAASQLQVREQQAERLEATLAAKENDALALRALLQKVSVEGKECVGASEAQSLQAELMHAAEQRAQRHALEPSCESLQAQIQEEKAKSHEAAVLAKQAADETQRYVSHLEQELEQSKSCVQQAAQELQASEHQAELVESSLAESRGRAEKLEAELGLVRSESDKRHKESQEYIIVLEKQLEESKSTIMQAAQELRAWEQQGEKLESSVSEKENMIRELLMLKEAQMESHKNQVDLLTVELDGKRCLEAELEKSRLTIAEATDDIKQLQERLDNAMKEAADLSMQLEESKSMKSKKQFEAHDHAVVMESQLEAAEDKVNEVTANFERIDLKVEALKIDAQIRTQQTKELREYNSLLEMQLEESRREIVNTAQELSQLEQQAVKLETQLLKKDESIKTLQAQIKHITEEMDQVTSESKLSILEAAGELKAREEQAKGLEEELGAREASMKELRERVEALTVELGEVRSRAEQSAVESREYTSHLEQEVEESKASILEAAGELKAREEQAMQFQTEITAIKSSLESCRQELVDSKESFRQKNNDLLELEFQLSSLWRSMAPEITNSSNFGKKGSFDLEDEPVFIKKEMVMLVQQSGDIADSEQDQTTSDVWNASAKLRDQVLKRAAEFAALRQNHDKLFSDLQDCKIDSEKSHKEKDEYIAHLEQDVENIKSSLADALQEMQVMDRDTALKELEQSEARSTEAAEQAKAREAERQELEAVLAERDDAIRGLQERLEVVTREMESLKASGEKARSEATEYQSFLEAESETAKRDVLEAASALQELQDKYDWVSKEHQDLQNQLDQRLEQELEQSEARSTEAAEQAKAREAERQELEAVLAERDDAIRGLQERLEVVRTNLSEKGAELEKLEITLQDRIREQEQYASFLESEIEVKTQDVMNAVHALEELQSKLDFVSEEAENEIHRHQEETETRENERIEMLQRLSSSNEQIAHLQAALEQSEQLHQSVASQIVSDTIVFEQTHAARQSEIRNLEVKLSDAEAKISCQTDLGTFENLVSVVPAFPAESATPLSDRDVAKFKAREKEQAEYASLLEQELAESQASAAQAGNALSVAEQHIERLQAEIQEIQGVHHDSISQTKTARRASESELEKVLEENAEKIPRPSSVDLLHSSEEACEDMSGGHNHQQNASMAMLAPATIAQRDLKDNKRKDLGANRLSSSVSRLVPTPSLPVRNVGDDLANAVDTSDNVSQQMSLKMPHSFVGLLILSAVLLVLAVASGSSWPSYLSAHKTLGDSTSLEKTQCGNQLQDLRKEYTKLAQQEAACQVNASQCASKFQDAHECETKLDQCQKQSERQSLQSSDLQSEVRSLHTQLFDKHADIETLRGEIVTINQKAEMLCKRKLADSLLACDEAKATRRSAEQLKRGPVEHDTNATTCRGYSCSSESSADSQGRWFARRPKVAHRLTREENARIFTAFF